MSFCISALVAISLLTGLNAHASSKEAFDNQKYLQQCGGKVYPKCNSAEMNQKTIYNEARELALKSDRTLLINMGADWCAPCLILDALIKSEKDDFLKINEKYVFVKLNGDSDSFKSLQKEHSWPGEMYPTMIVIDPKTNSPITSFLPTAFKSLSDIATMLNQSLNKVDQKPLRYTWYPSLNSKNDSNVSNQLLLRPIELEKDTQSLPSTYFVTIPDKPSKEKALSFYNQGLVNLFGFHYVDAARSFRSAILIEPKFYSAYTMLALALNDLYLFHLGDDGLNPMIMARELKKDLNLTESELAFADYVEAKLCSENSRICNQLGIPSGELAFEALNQAALKVYDVVKKESSNGILNLDFAVIANQYSPENLQQLLVAAPSHPGIHHYLVHLYEGTNLYREAVFHAEQFVRTAPKIAHSYHMYGHVLPKVGKWQQAVSQFLKADELHQAWFRKNKAKSWEDWHYEHNLNLLAHAYFFGGKYDVAEKYWQRRCFELKKQNCDEYYTFLIVTNKAGQAKRLIQEHISELKTQTAGFTALMIESLATETLFLAELMLADNKTEALKIFSNSKPIFITPQEEDGWYSTVGAIINADRLSAAEKDSILNKIQSSMAGGGFDSWSEAVLLAEYYKKLALKFGHINFASSIEVTKQAVGFRCK